MVKSTGLGKGVGGALFGETTNDNRFFECDIENIAPNKHQPRTFFDKSELNELSQSIVEKGVIQPLIVRRVSNDKYEIVAGERRLRASKIAGLKTVPVVVQNIESDDILLELALIENIQRTDLNALEEAEAYKKLIDQFGYTQEETAKRVGKKRSTVTNTLRLLLLPDYLKETLLNKIITEGHARALLRVVDDPATLREIHEIVLHKKLSVRQTEQLVRRYLNTPGTTPSKSEKSVRQESETLPNSYKKSFENQLTNKLDSKVVILPSGSRGKIEIEYYSLDDLERLVTIVINE